MADDPICSSSVKSVTTLGLVNACQVRPISTVKTIAGNSATLSSRAITGAGIAAFALPLSAAVSAGTTRARASTASVAT
jgi:hypothetical protein